MRSVDEYGYRKLEETYHHYGECPLCGAMQQPDYPQRDKRNIEWVSCDDCEIMWTLHHDDPTDKRDGTEPWRKYRISEIEPY